MWPEWGTRFDHFRMPDTPPSGGMRRTDLRFYRVADISAEISGVLLPSVVVGTYGYHYI